MKREDINKVLIIGSGPIVIGQACEFNKASVLDNDFSGVPLTSFGSGVPRALSFSCSFYFANAHSYTSFRNCFAGATYPNAFLPKTFSVINDVNFDDLEDSMQHGSALSADVDYIITRDTDDFKNCAVPAITPEQFLLIAHENWKE